MLANSVASQIVMPLVIIAGYPCSGKSGVASIVEETIKDAGGDVQLVSENDLFSDRNKCYATLVEEKNTRARIRSETDRRLTKSTTVILDALNFVKGYRYELWCLARAAGTKCCVLLVDTPIDTCRQWNAARPSEEAYSPEVFDDLASRFEPPNAYTRWDSPLHVARPTASPSTADAAAAVAAGLSATGSTSGPAKGPLATVSHDLRPNLATAQPRRAAATALHEVDRAAQAVVQRITEAQTAAGPGLSPGVIEIADGLDLAMRLPVQMADLRRLKRAYVKVATSGTCWDKSAVDKANATRAFVAFLRENLAGVQAV
eukprot:jgi/Ulvmu1/3906/UM018_0128.1